MNVRSENTNKAKYLHYLKDKAEINKIAPTEDYIDLCPKSLELYGDYYEFVMLLSAKTKEDWIQFLGIEDKIGLATVILNVMEHERNYILNEVPNKMKK